MHLATYCAVLIQTAVRTILRRRTRTLDPAFAGFVTGPSINLAARVLAKGMAAKHMRPRGHSVTAVYERAS
jgi:hypothetical protein